MAKRHKTKDASERSALDLLAEIRSGRLAPRTLDAPTRREVVACLVAEGASTAEIANLLEVTDRTIRRDLEEIRRANALRVSEEFPSQFAGELIEMARTEIGRLRRVGRDKNADAHARIAASREACEIMHKLTSQLQSLGFLPSATQRVHAELTHTFGSVPTLDEVRREVGLLQSLPAASEEQARTLSEIEEVAERASSVVQEAAPETAEGGDR